MRAWSCVCVCSRWFVLKFNDATYMRYTAASIIAHTPCLSHNIARVCYYIDDNMEMAFEKFLQVGIQSIYSP